MHFTSFMAYGTFVEDHKRLSEDHKRENNHLEEAIWAYGTKRMYHKCDNARGVRPTAA